MVTVVPPPQYAQRVGSDEPDEVTSWAARRDGDHSRVVHGTGPYGFRAAVLEGRSVRLAWARTRLGQTLRGHFQQPCVHVPLDGTQYYAFGRRRIGAAAGSLMFIAAGTETSRHSGAASMFAVDVEDVALIAEMRGRRPSTALQSWPQFPLALKPHEPVQRAFGNAIADLIRAFDPEVPSTQQVHCESRVIATLADAMAFQSEGTGAGRLAARRVADLEAWIDAHLADAITIGRLCEVAQVSERSLQLAFHARRGMSPLRFVCERLLAAANRRLSEAGGSDDITGIATSLGFTHLGRFSLAYREVFGESPSRTRRRSHSD